MSRIISGLYDLVLGPSERAGLASWRAELLSGLEGKVLEVGAGTGLNLAHYPETVERLVLAEPDPHMRNKLEKRVETRPRRCGDTSVIDAGAEYLPFPDERFDAVVATLVLCSVEDPDAAASEIHRVLKPGGRLVFIEHVGGREPRIARRQRRIEPVWKRVAANCHLTRDTAATLEASGLRLDGVVEASLPRATSWARPAIRGHAVKPD